MYSFKVGWSGRLRAARGQSLVEYGLILGLVAVVSVTALNVLGNSLNGQLTDLGDTLNQTASGWVTPNPSVPVANTGVASAGAGGGALAVAGASVNLTHVGASGNAGNPTAQTTPTSAATGPALAQTTPVSAPPTATLLPPTGGTTSGGSGKPTDAPILAVTAPVETTGTASGQTASATGMSPTATNTTSAGSRNGCAPGTTGVCALTNAQGQTVGVINVGGGWGW